MATTREAEHEFEKVDQPDEPTPPPRRSRGKLLKFGLPALILVMLVAGYFWLHGRNRESTDDAQVDGHIAPISAKVSGSVQKSSWTSTTTSRPARCWCDSIRAIIRRAWTRRRRRSRPLRRRPRGAGRRSADALHHRQRNFRSGRAGGGRAGGIPAGASWRAAGADLRHCGRAGQCGAGGSEQPARPGRSGAHAAARRQAGDFAAAV